MVYFIFLVVRTLMGLEIIRFFRLMLLAMYIHLLHTLAILLQVLNGDCEAVGAVLASFWIFVFIFVAFSTKGKGGEGLHSSVATAW